MNGFNRYNYIYTYFRYNVMIILLPTQSLFTVFSASILPDAKFTRCQIRVRNTNQNFKAWVSFNNGLFVKIPYSAHKHYDHMLFRENEITNLQMSNQQKSKLIILTVDSSWNHVSCWNFQIHLNSFQKTLSFNFGKFIFCFHFWLQFTNCIIANVLLLPWTFPLAIMLLTAARVWK